jgi:hypothetical protein
LGWVSGVAAAAAHIESPLKQLRLSNLDLTKKQNRD